MPYIALFKVLNRSQGNKYIYKDQIICTMQLSWQNVVNKHCTGQNQHYFDHKIFKDDQIIIKYHSTAIFELGLYLWYCAMFNKVTVTLDDNNNNSITNGRRKSNATNVAS